jgi:4-hydroxy-2-oxoheptanedioate aldolase
MDMPVNTFKQALQRQQPQIGLWINLIHSLSTEICAGAGFDWLLFDGEHTPNDLRSMLAHLQTIAAYDSQPVCRVPVGDTALIKQYLDLGVPNLLVPMVDTPEQARALVKACRYPPQGIRGMAGARASRWGRIARYAQEANAQICLLVQAETRLAMSNLDATAFSSARRTCRRRWVMWAMRAMPRFRQRLRMRSCASGRPARHPAS